MLIAEIYQKIKFCLKTDRIGPDIPFTHWQLYLHNSMVRLCKKKFKRFSASSFFEAGAYAVGCSQIEIGEYVKIYSGCMLFGETIEPIGISILIEDNVTLENGVHIYVNNHRFDRKDIPLLDQGYYPDKQVILKSGCYIGANSIILPGVTIGNNAVIGFGSIVTKSVADGVCASGNPAKVTIEDLYHHSN